MCLSKPCIAEFVNQGVSLYVENIFYEGSSTNQLGRLKVTFTNASKEDIRLLESFSNDKDIKHWFSVLIFDVNGTPNLDVSMGGKISMRKKMSYITLKRNESFSFILNRETIFPVLSPGEYDIKILYNNQYGESCFHGVLESNKIRVIVKDKK